MKPGLLMLVSVFFGCETSDDIGVQYELESEANVKFIEFNLPSTNIFLDSLRTDGENQVLVGTYTDELTGTVSAEGYLQHFYESGPMPRAKQFIEIDTVAGVPGRELVIPEDTIKLDSVIVTFAADNNSIPFGEVYSQDFRLVELQDDLSGSLVYLSRLQQTPTRSIGSLTQTIDPVLDSVYRLKLDTDFAQDFFNELSEIASDTNQNIATAIFNSLGLIPASSSNGIASFNLTSDTTRLVVYSSPIGSSDTTYLTNFDFSGANYTYLDRNNFSGSAFEGIVNNQNSNPEIARDFDLPSGQTLIDPLSGITTAFSLDSLLDFFTENPKIIINSAIMSFEFEEDSKRDTLENFMNYFREANSPIFSPAIQLDPFGNIVLSDNSYLTGTSDPEDAVLTEDKDLIQITATRFYQQLYRQSALENRLSFENLFTEEIVTVDELVNISSIDVTLQRTIFKNNGIKLKLYYTETN